MEIIKNTATYFYTIEDGTTGSIDVSCNIEKKTILPTFVISKKSNKPKVQTGDEVTYTLTLEIGPSDFEIPTQKIVDNLEPRLLFIEGTLKVDGETRTGTPAEIILDFEPNTAHTIEYKCLVR